MGIYEGLKNLNIVRKELKMKTFFKNWKTTTPALIAGIVNLLPFFGLPLPAGFSEGITMVAVTVIGLFARDADKTSEDSGAK